MLQVSVYCLILPTIINNTNKIYTFIFMVNLEHKISSLETKVQRLTLLNGILGLCFLTLLFVSATRSNAPNFAQIEPVVKANRFEMVNEAGKTLMVLEPRQTTGSLAIYNMQGKEIITLSADQTGSGALVQLNNMVNNSNLQLSNKSDGCSIKLFNSQGQAMLYAGNDAAGCGYLNLAQNGQPQIILDANAKQIAVSNPDSKAKFSTFPQKTNTTNTNSNSNK